MTELRLPKRLKGQHASVKRSKVQEASIAARLGAQQVKGSGAGDCKGDVQIEGIVRLEAKTTQHKSFRVTREIIETIEMQALSVGELPVLEIEIDNQNDPVSVAVIPTWALDALIDGAKK